MIKYVKIQVGEKVDYLEDMGEGRWVKLATAPGTPGTYHAVLTVIKDNGLMTVYTNTDEDIGGLLEVIVTDGSISGNRMMNYLPRYWWENVEMKQILQAQGFSIDILLKELQRIFTDAFIMTASEERVSEWELDLEIAPNGRTLEQRRQYVLSKLRGVGKLNEEKIKGIVYAFTSGGAIVTFSDSTIWVKVLPPNNGGTFLFPDIERTLKPMIPAHLGLNIKRYYSTWGDIRDNFVSWDDVYSYNNDWNAVRNFIERV